MREKIADDKRDPLESVKNTDREIWRRSDSYYSPSIHVTEGGGIGINVGGHVVVLPVEEWHGLAAALKAKDKAANHWFTEANKEHNENERLHDKLAAAEQHAQAQFVAGLEAALAEVEPPDSCWFCDDIKAHGESIDRGVCSDCLERARLAGIIDARIDATRKPGAGQ